MKNEDVVNGQKAQEKGAPGCLSPGKGYDGVNQGRHETQEMDESEYPVKHDDSRPGRMRAIHPAVRKTVIRPVAPR